MINVIYIHNRKVYILCISNLYTMEIQKTITNTSLQEEEIEEIENKIKEVSE